ncbi:unnamed protein product [Brugia timori]|uniref:Uncharacterized protein n=1 Tax=Brugia timori TaxID=42155 RepID=A0A3P7W497_9BILA|nr:unnamed protein product [Brugia timori]
MIFLRHQNHLLGISEYLVIMPLRNRRSIQLFSPTLSQ